MVCGIQMPSMSVAQSSSLCYPILVDHLAQSPPGIMGANGDISGNGAGDSSRTLVYLRNEMIGMTTLDKPWIVKVGNLSVGSKLPPQSIVISPIPAWWPLPTQDSEVPYNIHSTHLTKNREDESRNWWICSSSNPCRVLINPDQPGMTKIDWINESSTEIKDLWWLGL